jgi:hypothetical protein
MALKRINKELTDLGRLVSLVQEDLDKILRHGGAMPNFR